MAVTNIRSIENRASAGIAVNNVENRSTNPPNDVIVEGGTFQSSMWIPWCSSEKDYPAHHIEIRLQSAPVNSIPALSIWQDGDYVRWSTNGAYHPNANLVPGNSTVGGDRSVSVLGGENSALGLYFA